MNGFVEGDVNFDRWVAAGISCLDVFSQLCITKGVDHVARVENVIEWLANFFDVIIENDSEFVLFIPVLIQEVDFLLAIEYLGIERRLKNIIEIINCIMVVSCGGWEGLPYPFKTGFFGCLAKRGTVPSTGR